MRDCEARDKSIIDADCAGKRHYEIYAKPIETAEFVDWFLKAYPAKEFADGELYWTARFWTLMGWTRSGGK